MKSGKTILEIETGLRDVQAMICSPDTTMIAVGGYRYMVNLLTDDEFLEIWDVKTGKFITDIKGHTGGVHLWVNGFLD